MNPSIPFTPRGVAYAAACTALALNCSALLAQTTPPTTPGATSSTAAGAERLPSIFVTANPLGNADVALPVESLSGAELRLRGTASLGETLGDMVGVRSSGFAPAASRPVIRGLDGERIRILRNGGASFDASGLSADHSVPINMLAVESVEVLRGPAALLYGGNAIGGVVNVQDSRILRRSAFATHTVGQTGAVQAQFASADASRALGAGLDVGNRNWVLHADVASRRASDTRIPAALDCAGALIGRICNSAARSDEAALGASAFVGNWQVGASHSDYSSNYGAVAEDEVTIDMRQKRTELKARWEASSNTGWLRRFDLSHATTRYAHTEFEGPDAGTLFDVRGSGARAELSTQAVPLAGGLWESAYGLQVDHKRFSADGAEAFAPYSRTTDQAASTLQQWRGAAGQFSLGLHSARTVIRSLGNPRVDRFATGERRFSPSNTALAWLSPSAGGWQISANLARAQRAPTDAELYANGPHIATAAYEVGTSDLGLERAQHVELGLRFRRSGHQAQVQLFSTRYRQHIAFMPTGNTRDEEGELNPADPSEALPEWQAMAVPARFHGLEAHGELALSAVGLGPAWSVRWRYDRVSARNTATGEPLPRIAPQRVGATLLWGRGPWQARLGFDQHAAQSRVPAGVPTVSGYTLWHAALTWRGSISGSNLNAFATLDNATNRLAYSATSILTTTAPGRQPLAGRSLRVGVQLDW